MQFLIDTALILIYILAFLLICAWAWRFWKMYVNQKFLNQFNADMIMLEIKLPRDIMKSPLAMEVALEAIRQSGGVGSWYDRNFNGAMVAHFSLEIASLEGVIHFYIRLHKKFKDLIESNLYAQYPGIEISVADDYTKKIRYHHLSKDVSMWGTTYPLSRKWAPINKEEGENYKDKGKDYEMPADFYPLKTYVDFDLNDNPKEEFKIDPITPLLEFMGSIGRGEYVWYQVLVQDSGRFNDENFPKTYLNKVSHEHLSLVDMANQRKKQIRTSGYIKHGDKVFDEYGYEKLPRKIPDGVDEDGKPKFKEVPLTYNLKKKPTDRLPDAKAVSKKEMDLTPEEKEEIEMINRKVSKPLVRAIIRMLYITNGKFNASYIQNILSILRPFHGVSPWRNSFGALTVTPYEFAWEDIGGQRTAWRKEEKFEGFVEREGFFPHLVIGERKQLDKVEDQIFWNYSVVYRRMFRMIYEAIFHPFHHPHNPEIITLNLEELATLWHFPGQVAGTPTLPRIDSNKGVAPVNLPQ